MAPLVSAFEQDHPDRKGHIYYESIPPGLLVPQMRAGGRISVGNMTWTAKPDAFFGGMVAVKRLIDDGDLLGPPTIYATNRLAIMVPKANPAGEHDARLWLYFLKSDKARAVFAQYGVGEYHP